MLRAKKKIVNFFNQVKNQFGVIGVILLNNMYMNRHKISKVFIHDGNGVFEALNKLEFQSVISIFRGFLNNVLLSIRVLRDETSFDDKNTEIN